MSQATADAVDAAPPERRSRRWLRRGLSVTLGVLVGLVVAEVGFYLRDGGAFPHLNCYRPDAELGVRLEPGAEQRLSVAGQVTSVRINSQGFRGAEWPEPAADEILVVGDSQVFGLGVEDGESFSAALARELKRPVVNAGIPTYGPDEYQRVLEELVPKRKPKIVIYTVNLANDLFEAGRPNTKRHRVWDGWAVRYESAPEHVTQFPGRELVYRHSHLVLALRRWLHSDDPRIDQQRFPSEGGFAQVVAQAEAAKQAHAKVLSNKHAADARLEKDIEEAIQTANDKQLDVEERARHAFPDMIYNKQFAEYLRTHGNPGDITVRDVPEAIGPVTTTFIRGVEIRNFVEKRIRERAQQEIEREEAKAVLATLEERAAAEKRIAALRAAPVAVTRAASPLVPAVERAKQLVEKHGGRLVVLALPVDIQVSAREAAKYRRAIPDMSETTILNSDLVESTRGLGVSAVDALEPLRKAQPGAFLSTDLHMTPRGHAAVAGALAVAVREPPPIPSRPAPGLPLGRTRAPRAEEWKAAKPLPVELPDECAVRSLREWVLVNCSNGRVQLRRGGQGDAFNMSKGNYSALLLPVLGVDTVVLVVSGDEFGELRLSRPESAAIRAKFVQGHELPRLAPAGGKLAAELCKCQTALRSAAECKADLIGELSAECLASYADDCRALLACSRGSPAFPPACAAGEVNSGASERCRQLCDQQHPCKQGVCTESLGVSVCLPADAG